MKDVVMIGHLGTMLAISPPIRGTSSSWFRMPDGAARYTIQSGDTLGNLAAKYLGSWGRYLEIWNLQSQSWQQKSPRNGSPDKIFIGETLVMPDEAVQKAAALGLLSPSAPAAQPAPSPPPVIAPPAPPAPAPALPELVVNVPDMEITAAPPWPMWKKLAVGAAVLGAVGAGVWAATKRPTAPLHLAHARRHA